jgi:hypothetical protein
MHSGDVNWARVPIVLYSVCGKSVRTLKSFSGPARRGYIIVRDIVTVGVCEGRWGRWCGCFVELQGLFVYGRHRPTSMISLADARARMPAQHSSPGQQKKTAPSSVRVPLHMQNSAIHAPSTSFIARSEARSGDGEVCSCRVSRVASRECGCHGSIRTQYRAT